MTRTDPRALFIAKVLRKSPYEGRTRIAHSPHTGILSIACARCELKQLCCYINPDSSVKMSDVSEHSEFDYPKRKERKNKRRKSAVVVI